MRRTALVTVHFALMASWVNAGRVMDGIVVLYEFNDGDGEVVEDSGPGEPVDLIIQEPDNVVWEEGKIEALPLERKSKDVALLESTPVIAARCNLSGMLQWGCGTIHSRRNGTE